MATLLTALALYVQKLTGAFVPERLLDVAWVRRVLSWLPVALLSGLVVDQATSSPAGPVADARLVGLAVAAVALLLRAPFLVVLLAAAAATALVRALV